MSPAYIILLILGLTAAFVAGYAYGRRDRKPGMLVGTLQIDHSDPDMPYLFLLDYDLDYIATKKQAMFEVKVDNFISQN